ncbi:MAG: xanthine dehydrogenase family protein subunit M [Pseudomonadota bacterium]|nr:xanthine dehydrogenase family protein subunit M [Pseudomonadota bacterium]
MSEAYERPDSLDAALGLLAQGEWTVIAGGTDVYPMATDAHAWGGEGPRRLLDVTDIGEMRGIETRPDGHRIGGRVTWSDIVRADLPDYFDSLRLAAREVGGVQIQNRGTVAGNICNASPAADGVPPLLSLDAIVDIAGADGTRQLPLAQFIVGNRRTALKSGELVTGLFIPKRGSSSRATFLKLGARRYLVISIAMVAVTLDLYDAETIQDARVAVGACSEVACRLPGVEDALKGKSMTANLARVLTPEMFEVLSPIDDIRANAVYRRNAAETIVRRALDGLRTAI